MRLQHRLICMVSGVVIYQCVWSSPSVPIVPTVTVFLSNFGVMVMVLVGVGVRVRVRVQLLFLRTAQRFFLLQQLWTQEVEKVSLTPEPHALTNYSGEGRELQQDGERATTGR